jgi:nitrite reductase (NADH) small subunit
MRCGCSSSTRKVGVPDEAMRRYVIGSVADLPPGAHRVVEVAGRQIGVFNIRGRIYGLHNRCPHQAGPVCRASGLTGTLRADERTGWRPEWVHDGEVIACPWHGLEFHVPTGQCLAYPRIRLRRYEVSVDGDEIVVWMRT